MSYASDDSLSSSSEANNTARVRVSLNVRKCGLGRRAGSGSRACDGLGPRWCRHDLKMIFEKDLNDGYVCACEGMRVSECIFL